MALPASTRIYDALDVLNVCRHKFEGIFDMHGVRTGSPEDVQGFLHKLSHDRYFAMDFWGLVSSLEAAGDRISERQIRRTVMDCVCGEWLPNDDPASVGINRIFDTRARERAAENERLRPNTLVAVAIAAAGEVESSAAPKVVEPWVEPVATEGAVPEFVAEAIPEQIHRAEADVEPQATPQKQGQLPVVELGNVSGTSTVEHIDQMLSRLEMLNLELKLHLDNIDNRVSRLEPHIEELTTQVVRSLGLAADAVGKAAIAATPQAATPEVLSEEPAVVEAAPVAAASSAVAPIVAAPHEVASKSEEPDNFAVAFAAAPFAFEPIAEVPAAAAPVPFIPPAAPREVVGEERVPVPAFDPIAASFVRTPLDDGVAGSTAVEPRVGDDVWPALDWVGMGRSLRGVGTALGVTACLGLILWLWVRPRTEVKQEAPVASAPAVVPAPGPAVVAAPKVEPAKIAGTNDGQSATAVKVAGAQQPAAKDAAPPSVKEEVEAEINATINKAAAMDDPGAAKARNPGGENVAAGGVTKVSSKAAGTRGAGDGGYVASPWTKWYGGAPQGTKTAKTNPGPAGTKSEVQ